MALTSKQQRFVAEYTVDFNATAAAIRAGYSEKTAAQMGYKLLRMQEIQEAVQQEFANRQDRTHVTGDRIVEELAKIAFSNASDYAQIVQVDPDKGSFPLAALILTPTEKLTADQKAAIASIEETQAGIRVRTHDKVKALELLGKHLGIFTEKIAISGITPEMVQEVEAMVRDAAAGD